MPFVPVSIPSPPISSFTLGPVTIHIYALCIMAGIVVATLMTNRRLTRRGAEPWVVIDIALLAVPLALIVARFYHVFTHSSYYFRAGAQWWNPFERDAIWNIWDGGIAIFGALIGGAVGAWLGCRWTGIRFWSFADALAPGLLLAQAIGRFGNWFNHELFGQPTDLPWGLEISSDNPAFPPGLAEGTLFHPTFLYEVVWNTLGVVVLLWAGKRFVLQWGRLFGLYLVWYGAGRIVWESIRIDPSDIILGIRTNVWAAILAVALGVVIVIVQGRRHPSLEPSVYVQGRGPRGAVQSQNTDDFVDVSEPPALDVDAAGATSTAAAK
ncbi:prolipoprotein diacylglyceryl transferase [Microbacterium sp.]|uniref:prolipoprotein diacylglyceryl transferase n=1 Tax=Microbacterium sp. TaxID=51671 RepID=UPI0032221459